MEVQISTMPSTTHEKLEIPQARHWYSASAASKCLPAVAGVHHSGTPGAPVTSTSPLPKSLEITVQSLISHGLIPSFSMGNRNLLLC